MCGLPIGTLVLLILEDRYLPERIGLGKRRSNIDWRNIFRYEHLLLVLVERSTLHVVIGVDYIESGCFGRWRARWSEVV